MKTRDSFIVYKSFYDAIKCLPDADKLVLYNAIFEYGLNQKIIELTPLSTGMFALIKPNIDANYQRFVNGTKAKQKQNVSKPKAKQKQRRSKPEANKDVNVDVNKDVFDKFRQLYQGTIKGLDTEYENFKKHSDWETVLSGGTLDFALNNQIKWREACKEIKKFVPEWKNLQTWINQRCWEEIHRKNELNS